MSNPSISVILAAFNEKEHVAEAIESVIRQTFTNWELIFINEYGSNDGTYDIVKYFQQVDTRIILIQNEKKLGLSESLNIGIRLARGKYIARMDADDLCKENRFERQFTFLEENTNIDILGTEYVSLIGDRIGNHTKLVYDNNEIKSKLLFSNQICHPSVFIRKSTLLKYNLYYDKNLKGAEDYELWLRAYPYVEFANLADKLICYRQEENNVLREQTYLNAYNNTHVKAQKKLFSSLFDIDVDKFDEWLFVADMGFISQRIRKDSIANILAQKYELLCMLDENNDEKRIIQLDVFRKTLRQNWNSFLLKVHVDEILGKKYQVLIPQLDVTSTEKIKIEFERKIKLLKEERENTQSFIARQSSQIADIIPPNSKILFWGGGRQFLNFYYNEIRLKHINFVEIVGFSDSNKKRVVSLHCKINKIYSDDIVNIDYDFIIITPEQHYNEISTNLMRYYGVNEDKILPLSCLYSAMEKYSSNNKEREED